MFQQAKQPSSYAAVAAIIAGIPEFNEYVGPAKMVLLGIFGLLGVVLNEKSGGSGK